MGELRRRLEDLAGRGEPRGAVRVWQDATADPALGRPRRVQPAVAFLALVAVTALVGAAVVNLSGSGPGGSPSSNAPLIGADRLDPLANCDALLGYLKKEARARVGPYGLAGAVAVDAAGTTRESSASDGTAPTAAPATGATAGATSDFSSTNVQETGVDEPDIVETDGDVVYTLAGGRLWAVRERGTPVLLGSLGIDDAVGMVLDRDRMLVLGGGGPAAARIAGPGGVVAPAGNAGPISPRGGTGVGTTITIVDVREPAAMKVTSSFAIDSSYVSARMVGGVARIVVSSPGPALPFVYPSDGSGASIDRATSTNREVVDASTLADWLPSYTQTVPGAAAGSAPSHPLDDCARTFAPPVFSGFGLLSVLTVDPADPHIGGTTSVVAAGQTVYASTDRLYVATSQWAAGADVGGGAVPAEGPVRRPAPAVPDPTRSTTQIHVFDISGAGPARYLVSGEVRGTVLNQFAMSEYEGRLRVATTDPVDGTGSESFLTVLADDGARLGQVGQVGGLGKGEQIRAVRFVGDRGYVVTFRQTDPLYVLDLADPAAPRVTGELGLLGYSAYLHPLDGDLLLGVGQDADAAGRVHDDNGTYSLQVSLFDVSDPANPRRLGQRVVADAVSEVGDDHHAFLYWPASGLAVVPVETTSTHGGARSEAVGLRVTPPAIDEVARLEHPVSQADNRIERSLVVGDRLVTVSASGLLSSDIATLQPGAWVPLR